MSRRLPVADLAGMNGTQAPNSRPSLASLAQNSSTSTVSTEDLREYFECPVCYEVPRAPPIYACSQGHMLCGQCRPQLLTCPLCRIPLENLTRLFFAERMLEERIPLACSNSGLGCKVELISERIKRHELDECPFGILRCENAENGCREKVQRRHMAEHLEKCEWKPVECPIPTCSVKLPRTKVLIHLQTQHLSVFASGWMDSRTKFFLGFFLLSLLLNIILFWQFSQSGAWNPNF